MTLGRAGHPQPNSTSKPAGSQEGSKHNFNEKSKKAEDES